MAGRLVSPLLVGRSSELAALTGALDRAAGGAPSHQLVAGEAGVGKSRLVREAASVAAGRGFRVLSGSCADAGDGGVPYGPIVEALRGLVRDLDDASLDAVIGPNRAELALLVPSLGRAPDIAVQFESLQPRLLDAVLGVIQRLAARGPVLLVVEDLHWADPATREVIASLVRQLGADPVLLLMTFRVDELRRRHPLLPWLAELERSGRVERIDLERFDPARTRELLAAILDAEPAPALVERIHQRSDGNPFFVEELLGAASGIEDGRLPPTLRDVLLARILALSDRSQAVIRVAAVAGRRVDHELLSSVAGLPDGALIAGLREAVGSGIIVTEPGDEAGGDYAFRHALLQEAAYEDLLPGERQQLHQAFGEALAGRPPGSGAIAAGYWAQLAHHWMAARDDRRAFDASVRAGEAAALAYAFADSRRHDERALELWARIEDPEAVAGVDRATLLERAALGSWLAGDSHRAVDLRREVVIELAPAADSARLGIALERLGRALWYDGDAPAALEACQRAIAVIPPEPPTPELARVLAGYGQLLMLLDRWDESADLCARAVAMARATGARQAEGHALNTLGVCRASGGDPRAVADIEAALAIAYEIGSPDDIGRAFVNLSESHRYLGDPRSALEVARRGVVAAHVVGLAATYAAYIRENGIAAAYELGQWEEAATLAAGTVAHPQSGRVHALYSLTRWVPLLIATGDERAAARLEELRVNLAGTTSEGQFRTPYRIAAAEAALWHGDPSEAVAAILAGIAEAQPLGWQWHTVRLLRVGMRAIADVAEVARARREPDGERAAIVVGDALWADFKPVLADAAIHQQGLAASETAAEVATTEAERLRLRREPAAAAWAGAAERWRARENPYLVAQCRWREAEACLAEGDRAGAAPALLEAHEIACTVRARPLRAAIEGLAARGRIDLAPDGRDVTDAPAPAADPFGLTPRERDVLPLIVAGRTNRQIAEALFISENTAGVHVSNILGKLGASSRAEAAGIAVRLGIGLD